MTAEPLPELNDTMRDFATKAFEIAGLADASQWSKPGLCVPTVLQALGQFHVDDRTPGEAESARLLDGRIDAGSGKGIAAADWDLMFSAIESRLRAAVGDRLAGVAEPGVGDLAGQVQVAVLDCISAMSLLHTALKNERESAAKPRVFVTWP